VQACPDRERRSSPIRVGRDAAGLRPRRELREASEVTDVVDKVVGRPAISFTQFVHDHADRFARP